MFSKYHYVVVGSGLFGLTIAHKIATALNEKVLVIEKRSHIGGNCHSEHEPVTGIEYHKYGSHIFHTSDQTVWDFINQFGRFNNYIHKVYSKFQSTIYSLPINLGTINHFYNAALKPFEVDGFIKAKSGKITNPRNFEEKAISLIGEELYRAFIYGYTKKQWSTDPKKLPAEIISRLPVRNNYDNNYFDDKYQGLPVGGWANLFRNMVDHENIDVMLNLDFFDIRTYLSKDTLVVYSGPIDRYFDYNRGKLGWRTVEFESEIHAVSDYQGNAVINYADEQVPYTRVHEYKHYHPERQSGLSTFIQKEYSKPADTKECEPFYPINDRANMAILEQYQIQAEREPNTIFGGRLGSYKYYDMDDVILAALQTFETKVSDFSRSTKPNWAVGCAD